MYTNIRKLNMLLLIKYIFIYIFYICKRKLGGQRFLNVHKDTLLLLLYIFACIQVSTKVGQTFNY